MIKTNLNRAGRREKEYFERTKTSRDKKYRAESQRVTQAKEKRDAITRRHEATHQRALKRKLTK